MGSILNDIRWFQEAEKRIENARRREEKSEEIQKEDAEQLDSQKVGDSSSSLIWRRDESAAPVLAGAVVPRLPRPAA